MELFHRYQYPMPDGTISESGQREIERLLGRQRLNEGAWADFNPESSLLYLPSLPEHWEWVWKVMRGEYRGTFPKRIGQYFKKRFGLKCPESFLAEIGELARRHSSDGEVYEFEFDNEFNWYSGQYGDEGSCLYDDRTGAFQMMRVHGALGMCFYQPGGEIGIGRAFVYDAGGYHVIWNGYGLPGDATLKIAQIFARWRGEDHKRIEVSNGGHWTGVLWINGTGHGYAVGKADVLASLTQHDFDWNEIYARRCYRCDEIYPEDEGSRGPDDEWYCDRCHSDMFTSCDICGEAHYFEDVTYVDERDVCTWCLRDHYTECAECGEHIHRRNAHTRGGKSYCETCFAALPDPKK